MNKLYFILVAIGVIFFIGQFIYASYGDKIREKFNLPNITNKNASVGDYSLANNPNGLQANSIQRNSSTQ